MSRLCLQGAAPASLIALLRLSTPAFGTNDFLPLTRLQKGSGSIKFSFRRNSKEIFYVRGPFLGELKSLVVEHSGLEDVHSWFLDSVDVFEVYTKRSWIFKCDQWLSLRWGKRRLRLQLNSSSSSHKMASFSKEYRITVETGNCRMAGTNANVYITLYGRQTHSDKIHLDNRQHKCFQRGDINTFVQELNTRSHVIEHDNKGIAAGWYLNKITIESLHEKASSGSVYIFPVYGWLANDAEGGKLWREIEAQNYATEASKEEKLKRYQILITTGTQRFAGTDAQVSIQIIGDQEKTSKLILKSEGNCFERGSTDLFEVKAVDVGHINRITIGHDNSGVGAGWYLKEVVIRSYGQNKKRATSASCKSTIKMHRKNKKAAFRSNDLSDISEISDEENNKVQKNVVSKEKSKNNVKKMPESPVYIEYTFVCEQWLATDEGDGKTSKCFDVTDVKCFYE
ncbi:unnamed protein product [Acanthosepion pharaonis]|uniref:PLAT domain-containing protein n=1 Tax=Acanthosepion pharaonis TaxID=158019 RepID=A0A812E6N8_ACAPH|nr:unnamed protein product [Sepia pharaonis]